MNVLDYLKEVAEDLLSLEVATLTNAADMDVPLTNDLTPEEQQTLDDAKTKVTEARAALIAAIETGADDIRAKRKTYRALKRDLEELKKAMGIYDPKDVFSKIRVKLGEGENIDLVAYSRFEIEGDSVNYLTNKEALKPIAELHSEMVSAAQESRKALFDTVMRLA